MTVADLREEISIELEMMESGYQDPCQNHLGSVCQERRAV